MFKKEKEIRSLSHIDLSTNHFDFLVKHTHAAVTPENFRYHLCG